MLDKTSRIIFVLGITLVVSLLLSVQLFVEPYSLKMRVLDSIFVGAAVPVVTILFIAVSKMKADEFFSKRNLMIIGMTGVGVLLTLSRGGWLFYREAGEPQWVKEVHSWVISGLAVFATFIYAGGDATVEGRILPRSAFLWAGLCGATVSAILLTAVLLGA